MKYVCLVLNSYIIVFVPSWLFSGFLGHFHHTQLQLINSTHALKPT